MFTNDRDAAESTVMSVDVVISAFAAFCILRDTLLDLAVLFGIIVGAYDTI